MEPQKGLNVYVLGAGCSARYGYPLAKTFCAALREHADTLRLKPGCERLSQIASQTVELMEKHGTPTIDRLTCFLHDAAYGQRLPSILWDDPANREWREKEALTLNQIRGAKIAAMSLFLHREESVLDRDLPGYNDLLSELFADDRRVNGLSSTKSRVLSFNQDRLFEMAFCRYFRCQEQYACGYHGQLLNSGMAQAVYFNQQAIEPRRFCFLKLHGSAGTWTDRFHSHPRYIPLFASQFNDEFCWPTKQDRSRLPGEPLLVFPVEKDGVFRHGHKPAYAEYLQMVWDHAASLIAQASRIYFIGYSFDPHDRQFLLQHLLGRVTSDCQIIVQGIEPDLSRITKEMNLIQRFEGRFESVERLF